MRIKVLLSALMLVGCASMMGVKREYSKLEKPIALVGVRNYLPKDVSNPAYTIYDGAKWTCPYKTTDADYVCCANDAPAIGSWKYCLVVDPALNAFAFIELGNSQSMNWSEGKQAIFAIAPSESSAKE